MRFPSMTLLISLLTFSCNKDNTKSSLEDDFKPFIVSYYDSGLFDSLPTNLSSVNSEYDDYNSAYPPGQTGYEREIVFSSNRNSKGENFDFIYFGITIMHDLIADSLIGISGWTSIFDDDIPNRKNYNYVNTQYDELGPYYWKNEWDNYNKREKTIFMYSNNSTGNQDIKCLVYDACSKGYDPSCSDTISEIKSFTNINTNYNESYPSIQNNQLFFTSDRDGDYDIYFTEIIKEDIFNTSQLELSSDINKVNELSSPYSEKCPFVNGDLMVFSSDSKAGFGGYDLWYSIMINGKWTEPRNFGKRINTEYDEYRPITISIESSNNDLMIFSSNRPDGKGGFDLYYTGIAKLNVYN